MPVAPAPALVREIHPARRKALDPFLDKLRAWSASGGTERSARVTVGAREIVLEAWEREQLEAWFRSGDDIAEAHRALAAHGAALMVKATYDIEKLARHTGADTESLYALQAELMLDSAIGMALLRDAQPINDGLIQAGRFEVAKGLTQFRHRLSRLVSDTKMCIAESERVQAEGLADVLVRHPAGRPAPARPSAPRSGPVAPQPKPRPPADSLVDRPRVTPAVAASARSATTRPRRSPRPAATPPPVAPPSSTKLLALFTLTAGVAWFAIVQAPQWTHEPSRTLDRGSFDVPSIVAVDSRAPSAYVTIKSAAWGQLGPSDRLDLIESLGRAAGAEDFRGLLLRDESGVPVAQWLRNRGVQVIEPLEALPVPTDTPGLEEALPPVFEELPAGLDEPSAALEEPPPVLEEPPAGIEELSPDIEDPRSVLEEPPPVPDASPAPPVEDEP